MKITGTPLRTHETMLKYSKIMAERAQAKSENRNSIYPYLEEIVHETKYWKIVKNDFPYDAIADISHMLFPKRDFIFDWDLMNSDERSELDILKKTYLNDYYDLIQENLTNSQTVPSRFHLHLLKLKRYEIKK